MTDADCVAFLQWALPRLGLRWPGFRKVRRQVCKRIERHVRELGLPGVAAYRRELESKEREWHELARLCTVTISRFYRDRAAFDCLGAEVLPALARAALERGERQLDCWSVGCACGEEAYTLAIQWQLSLRQRFPALGLQVLGTDVDAKLLERANAACYKRSSLEELPAAWRERAFEKRANLLCLREEYRRAVEFERQDLLSHLPQRRFDLVLCRNLAFTYFGSELARKALERLSSRLHTGGALVIGLHERLPEGTHLHPWPGCRAVYAN